jgi:hypothetical protein
LGKYGFITAPLLLRESSGKYIIKEAHDEHIMTKHSWRGGFCNYYFISARTVDALVEHRREKKGKATEVVNYQF